MWVSYEQVEEMASTRTSSKPPTDAIRTLEEKKDKLDSCDGIYKGEATPRPREAIKRGKRLDRPMQVLKEVAADDGAS